MNETLKKWIGESKRIVFFGGAGVSTESGIPDFRSVDGLYNEKYDYPPEVILSHDFFMEKTLDFFEFYREKMIFENAEPNNAHKTLSALEEEGKLLAVITQNIDGLHQRAGSKNVYELHGSVYRNRCMSCGREYSLYDVMSAPGVPYCECGGIIKPDVVLYDEPLDSAVIKNAIDAICNADMLIIGGTSLSVYPAAGLINYYGGKRLVLINKTPTPIDSSADLLISGAIGEALTL